ncbi:MAG TPA: hypothetical protein VF719_07755, partial [Abditibacteriaceae bacterium]
MLTVENAYKNGVAELLSSGYDLGEARVTLRLFLEAVCHARHVHLMEPHRVLSLGETTNFQQGLDELKAGRPLPHILGECEFCGLTFH